MELCLEGRTGREGSWGGGECGPLAINGDSFWQVVVVVV